MLIFMNEDYKTLYVFARSGNADLISIQNIDVDSRNKNYIIEEK